VQALHADPHSGNYLFNQDGSIGLDAPLAKLAMVASQIRDHFGVADDGIERGAQFVAHVGITV
jgi:predicted unusual protein kinase regulating ubiquinone biosynthesis (AarF/ABC1/UbiB family)